MKKTIIILVMILVGFATHAQEKAIKNNKNAKVEFGVSGNCEMCKARIEKAAYSVSGVKTADWHIDTATLYLIMNENKTDIATIQKAITKVGHDTEGLKATDDDYDKLHHCCAYDRE